ncbi:hypothetical protein [Micromonospora arida]
MTTKTTTPPTEAVGLAEAGDKLLDEVRDLIRPATIDMDALASAIVAFEGAASGRDTAGVRAAVATIVSKHKQGYEFRDAQTASRMAAQHLWRLTNALDDLLVPFDRAEELTAAEQTLAGRERAAQRALADLEQAVQDGDVDKVMALRGEVEVKHPRAIAEARTAVLELRIERERAGVDARATRARQFAGVSSKADTEHREAVARLARAAEDAALANLAYGEVSRIAHDAKAGIGALERELGELKANHEQEMQARLRRIAGLPEVGQPEADDDQGERRPTSLIGQSTQPYAPGNRPDTFVSVGMSPGLARHIDAPAVDLSPTVGGF